MIVSLLWYLSVSRARCTIVKSVVVNSSVARMVLWEIANNHCHLNWTCFLHLSLEKIYKQEKTQIQSNEVLIP